MNENIDLTKILKNCPRGFELYTPLYGKVFFLHVWENATFSIQVRQEPIGIISFTKDGHFFTDTPNSECLLLPSHEMRDWSKFTAPWYNKEESIKPKFKVGDIIRHKETNKNDVYKISKVYNDSYGIAGFNWGIYMEYQDQYELVPNKFDPNTLKPFDKVLSRYDGGCWSANLFSHIEEEDNEYYSTCSFVCNGSLVKFCIPYNDDTKHLVGTKKEVPEYYRYWED